MLAARSLACAIALVPLAGCSDSDSNITAAQVTRVLRDEGFSVAVVRRDDRKRLERVFAQDVGEVEDVVATYSAPATFRPAARLGVGDLTVVGLIYAQASDATCSRSNVVGVCLHRRNVVIVVRDDEAATARRALAKLD